MPIEIITHKCDKKSLKTLNKKEQEYKDYLLNSDLTEYELRRVCAFVLKVMRR